MNSFVLNKNFAYDRGGGVFLHTLIKLLILTAFVETIVRIVLIFNPSTNNISFSVSDLIRIFLLGMVNTALMTVLFAVPLLLFMLGATKSKYNIIPASIIGFFLIASTLYVASGGSVFEQYGGGAKPIALSLFLFWTLSFALRFFVPRIRLTWLKFWFAAIIVIYVALIFLNAVAEYFFWGEFGVRYNFLAVDYLVYTNELAGNILESYPCTAIGLIDIAAAVFILFFFFRNQLRNSDSIPDSGWRPVALVATLAVSVVAYFMLPAMATLQNNEDKYVNELQADGPYNFVKAFFANTLSYKDFYVTVPKNAAETESRIVYDTSQVAKKRVNIVVITMESMSGSYLSRFGQTKKLTPVLDSLYFCSLAFDSLYANGNRTVRGLEAISLSLPPSPGESRIRQKNNGRFLTVGEQLKSDGYSASFVYGGFGTFDNMSDFFSANGYEVIDRNNYSSDEITFANIWGVCDEDIYRKTLQVCDSKAVDGKPFFVHVMSVSNHRPYLFPSSFKSEFSGREEGVRYADYALGGFLKAAAGCKWFDNTVFVIMADHCASSAGNVDIPLEQYHIPALIYSPSLVKPRIVSETCSQIDLIPTVCAMFGLDYKSRYGEKILAQNFKKRAFVATYESLGYLDGNILTVLSPVRKCEQFCRVKDSSDVYALKKMPNIIDEHLKFVAASLYQTADLP